ncbi:hypothetical protein M1446_02815 [Candidatus Dependentiae bacterium]|nr:hypothetical protein [Candidatus Dependentiae bacterium]
MKKNILFLSIFFLIIVFFCDSIFSMENDYEADIRSIIKLEKKIIDTQVRAHKSDEKLIESFNNFYERCLQIAGENWAKHYSHENIGLLIRHFFGGNDPSKVKALIYACKGKLDFNCIQLPSMYTLSIANDWPDVFELLLKHDVHCDKNELLHNLIHQDFNKPINIKYFEIVLKNGANINSTDNEGKTILDWAKDYKHKSRNPAFLLLETFLIKRGALSAKKIINT